MKKLKSENYIFNYYENSVAERDILKIAEYQESCFKYICSVLQIKTNFKIEYYLCNSSDEVGKFYGDNEPCNGFARKPNKIYAVYNDNVKCIGFHEDAHLISYSINCPNSTAIREGLAMFFDKKWWNIHNQEWTAYYLKNNKFIDIDKLLKNEVFNNINCTVSYPIVGSFTEYIILTYGIDKYLELYRTSGKIINAIENVYNESIDVINNNFVSYISLFKIDEVVEKRINELLKN